MSPLKTRRLAAWMSQADLAIASGVGRHTIQQIEQGKRPHPWPKTVRALAVALRCRPEDIMNREAQAMGRSTTQ